MVGGKYRVVGTLGEGASGSVFRALDTGHVGEREFETREVALKVSRVDTAHDGLNRDLLQKEARLLRRLRHPRLPAVEALFEDRGRWVVAMEYIAGDSLQKRRRERSAPVRPGRRRPVAPRHAPGARLSPHAPHAPVARSTAAGR